MNQIVNFLNDYYVYVVGIGAVLLLILIGFLANRRKARKKAANNDEGEMANINKVETGEINQVADTVEQNRIKPVEVSAMPASDTLVEDKKEVAPELKVEPTVIETKTPLNDKLIMDNGNEVKEEDEDKTEVMNFKEIPEPKEEAEPITINNTPNVTNTVNSNNDSILNGEETLVTNNEEQK